MAEENLRQENEREENPQENGSKKKIKLEEPADLTEKIQKQIEYYFSDVNVVKDKFLQEEFKKEDGWVKLSVLLTFIRLQQLTKDESRIIEALKDYKSEIFEFDAEKKSIRRKKPLPDPVEYEKEIESRSVHISGFPVNYQVEELRQFCNQYGEVESMSMRRHFKTRFFKGCIHVVYKSEESAKKVLAEEVLKCKDRELRTESMDKYHIRKREYRARGKKAK